MENYNAIIECVKVGMSAFATYLSVHLGASSTSLMVLLYFIGVDTLIGWLVAKHKGEWQSSKARWGFVGKIVELIFVSLLFLLDWAFNMDILKYIGIYYFIICEGASIVENIAKINNNIPEGLVEVLKSLQKSAGTGVVKWVQKTVDKIIGGGRNE